MWCGFGDLQFQLHVRKKNNNRKVPKLKKTIKDSNVLESFNYVRQLWRIIERKFGINLSFEQILGLDPLFEYDAIATTIYFLTYKEWLLLSLENKQRSDNLNQMYFKSELQYRVETYKLCKCIDQNHVDNLVEIMLLM